MGQSEVGRVGGPGSLTVPVAIDLVQLRTRLNEAGHPLGTVPQWNGDSFYLVSAYEEAMEDGRPTRVMLISAPTSARAEEVALNFLKTRNGPEWSVISQSVELDSCRQLQATMVI